MATDSPSTHTAISQRDDSRPIPIGAARSGRVRSPASPRSVLDHLARVGLQPVTVTLLLT
jgi:hypothetical protein